REGDVVAAAHRVEERPALEDDAVAPADRVERLAGQPRDLLVVHQHAAGVGPQQADEMLEEDGLAAAAAPDDHGDRARRDLEVDAPQHGLPAEALGQSLDLDHRLASPTAAARKATLTGSPRRRLRLARPRSQARLADGCGSQGHAHRLATIRTRGSSPRPGSARPRARAAEPSRAP